MSTPDPAVPADAPQPDPSPLLALPGAVPDEGVDAAVAAHYGDPFREQRTLAEAVGWVDRTHREVVTVTGQDRLSWLHDLTTQHLRDLPDGHGAEGLVLSAQGHVEHHFVAADLAGTTWLDVEFGTAPALAGYLESMRFLLRVEPADVSARWAVLTLVGPETPRVLAALGEIPTGDYAVTAVPEVGGWVRRMPWPGPDAADLMVPRESLPAVAERLGALGATPAGLSAFEALRVADRRPRLGRETDHRTIPHELGWLETAVHLDKGCYRGQETVARVHNLGRPPRRMVLAHLDGAAEIVPETGAAVSVGGRQVGYVGTAVRHFELGPIALAVVRRNTPDDADLVIATDEGSVDARIDPDDALGDDATPRSRAPRVPRLPRP